MNVIQGSRNSWGDDMGAFLCFMAVRLIEMRRVLKPTGSIYLHCDPTASHYLKELMDAIFGRNNFRNEVIWKRTNAPTASPYQFGCVHDKLLFYGASENARMFPVFIPYSAEYIAKHYGQRDRRGAFHKAPLTAQGIRHGHSGKSWRGIDVTAKSLHWVCPTALPDGISLPEEWNTMLTQDKLDWLDVKEMIYWPRKGTVPRFKRYLSTVKGTRASDVMVDVPAVMGSSKERTGYPTQKPVALYGRIITASSQEGDMVLDPFCGCATTPIAAERLKRQWVGVDIWDGAKKVVLDRMAKEGLLQSGQHGGRLFKKDLHFLSEPPVRTDDNTETSPYLQVRERVAEPYGPKWSRAEMYEHLLKQYGMRCQGCDRVFDDPRYLELDHNTPRADGGINHISNRILLCSPCNRAKSNTFTLSGLRRHNKKNGWMAK